MYPFKKEQRLVTKSDYDLVFEHATKLVTTEFVIFYKKNTLGHARLGLALSKKTINKAHERNRIKRLLREGFRKAQLPALDMIFLARSGIAKKTNGTINTQLNQTWVKLASC